MTKIHDDLELQYLRLSLKSSEVHHAAQMRELLSQIPRYALQARQRLEKEGRDSEMLYWLGLYNEFNTQAVRSLSISNAHR